MNKPSRTSIIITVLAVIVIALVVWAKYQAMPTPTTPDASGQVPAAMWPSREVHQEHLDETTGPYAITAAYPVTGDERITLDLKAFVQGQIDQFKEDTAWANDPSIAPAESNALSLDITYTESANTTADNYVFNIASYTGGAHGLEATTTFSYDKYGKKLAIGDLFTNGEDGLETIATYVMKVISSRKVSDQGWIAEGAAPTVENYRAFTIDSAGITFIFDPYQVAPYAAGKQTVTVPLAAFKSIANPDIFK